jgi:FAD/FMN-containing dehydrogenase
MSINRRDFLKAGGLLAAAPAWAAEGGTFVNDIHSQLNETRVREVVAVESAADMQNAIARAASAGHSISIAGGRHAMGAQQFGTDSVLLDVRKFNRVRSFDRANGIVEVDAGIMWPALVDYLLNTQAVDSRQWGIRQKQTGADRLTIGGALAANVHGPWTEDETVHR